jgi:DNA-binding MarR family transcriptional regulator
VSTEIPGPELLGTALRHLLEQLDSGVAQLYTDLGLPGFRPRFTPFVRVLRRRGPSSITDLATEIGVTHSAASQTVAALRNWGLVELRPGTDARSRIAHLTGRAIELLPTLDAEWAATRAAAEELEAELPMPLHQVVAAATEALRRRPYAERVAAAAKQQSPPPPTFSQ